MYYLKLFLLYSLLGFVMESTLFKILLCKKHSGIFYGPITAVYGIGIMALTLIDKYMFSKIKKNTIIKLIIEYITVAIILTLIEYIGGNTLEYIFNITMWNYTKYKYHFGKYICLNNSLIWGLLGVFYINIFKKFTDKLLKQINNRETILFLFIFTIDLIVTLITKT